MVAQLETRPVAPGPTGLIRTEVSESGSRTLLVPGPLTGEVWHQLAASQHPQLARAVLLEDGREGALIHLDPPLDAGGGSPTFSDPTDVAKWLQARGVWQGSARWSVRVVASRLRPPFFVVLPLDLAGVPGWRKLRGPLTEQQVLTRPLPLHRRARFRVGAITAVTLLTLAAMFAVWSLRFHVREEACPKVQEAGVIVEELLTGRARALVDQDLDALALVESGDLLARDGALLEQKGRVVLGEVRYSVSAQSVECEPQGARVSGEIVAHTRSCASCDEKESKRDFRAKLSRPWRIEEFD